MCECRSQHCQYNVTSISIMEQDTVVTEHCNKASFPTTISRHHHDTTKKMVNSDVKTSDQTKHTFLLSTAFKVIDDSLIFNNFF